MLLMFDIAGEPTREREEAAFVFASSDEAAKGFSSDVDNYTINGEGLHMFFNNRYKKVHCFQIIGEIARFISQIQKKGEKNV